MSGLGRYGVRAEKLAKEPSLSRTGRQIFGEKAGKRARQAEKKSNWGMARGAKSRNLGGATGEKGRTKGVARC